MADNLSSDMMTGTGIPDFLKNTGVDDTGLDEPGAYDSKSEGGLVPGSPVTDHAKTVKDEGSMDVARESSIKGRKKRLVIDSPFMDSIKSAGRKFTDALGQASYKINRGINQLRQGGERAVKGYSMMDVYDLGPNLLKTLEARLREFARTCHGSPVEYDIPSNWLVHHDADWLDSIAPYDAIRDGEFFITSGESGDGNEVSFCRFATVSYVGPGFCAWVVDLTYAADVIHEYLMMHDDLLWVESQEGLYGKEEVEERARVLEKKFREVWAWIGEWVFSLWD